MAGRESTVAAALFTHCFPPVPLFVFPSGLFWPVCAVSIFVRAGVTHTDRAIHTHLRWWCGAKKVSHFGASTTTSRTIRLAASKRPWVTRESRGTSGRRAGAERRHQKKEKKTAIDTWRRRRSFSALLSHKTRLKARCRLLDDQGRQQIMIPELGGEERKIFSLQSPRWKKGELLTFHERRLRQFHEFNLETWRTHTTSEAKKVQIQNRSVHSPSSWDGPTWKRSHLDFHLKRKEKKRNHFCGDSFFFL